MSRKGRCFKDKCIYYAAFFVIIASMTMLLYFMYLAWIDGNPPIVFNENPFPVQNNVVYTCGYVNTIPSGCRYTNVPVIISYSFVDGYEYAMTPLTYGGTRKSGDCWNNTVFRSYHIPSTLPSGDYKLRGSLTYKVNPIATRTVNFESEYFQVINNGEKC